ncbi:hypothetical protein HD806DRAFT_529353 [Xylariaceae sp. AK1471]|nr:hypothetical protein HD806DRAFT_529353 [Xylariaceae sp. AK1471]
MRKHTGKNEVAEELPQEEEQPEDIRQQRSGAPTPEPVPVEMPANGQQTTQNPGAVSWEQYAVCGNMPPFRVLGLPNENQQPFVKVESPDRDQEKERIMDLAIANAPKGPRVPTRRLPTSSTWVAGRDPVLANAPKGPRGSLSLGDPSPKRHDSSTPIWVRDVETAPRTERFLEEIYRGHLEKELQGGIEPATLNLAARVILQVVNEATLLWCRQWCPNMDINEVFEVIRVEGQEGELTNNQYIVPPEAFDLGNMTTTLSEMFRQCHNVHPKGSGDIQFPQLLNLLDKCTVFMGVLKDYKRKALLQKTKSTFQWIPVYLDAKKLLIEKRTVADLQALNKKYEQKILKSNGDVKILNILKQERDKEELTLLDEAMADFDSSRTTFRVEILNGLKVLLAAD